jgi:hypothetical protein
MWSYCLRIIYHSLIIIIALKLKLTGLGVRELRESYLVEYLSLFWESRQQSVWMAEMAPVLIAAEMCGEDTVIAIQ